MINMEIYSLAYGAAGVARPGGKVCFVKGALPGEEVTAEIVRDTPRYSEAEITEIIRPSPHRVTPACPFYGRCGGCQLQHIHYDKELHYKQEQVTELFRRIAGEDVTGFIEEIERSPSEYGYRTSVTIHRGEGGYGYYAASSHEVVNIDRCPVAVEAINGALKEVTDKEDRDEITIRSDYAGGVWSSCRAGHRFYLDRYSGVDMYLSPKSFSQCNRHISEKIAETIGSWIGPVSDGAGFFDIYCGSGFFSFLVKGDFSVRAGMDENRISIDCAKNTARSNGLKNVKFYRGSVEKDLFDVFYRTRKHRNVFVLDPPRKGADKVFLEKIREEESVSLVYYVSCDPARMARDSRILTGDGKMALRKIKAYDMFPRTKHIEVLAEFARGV